MKKFAILLGLLFAFQFAMKAQITDEETVTFYAHLLATFNLNVDGVDQEITFATPADYNNGVTEAGGIAPGFTVVTVEATGNWNLAIEAPDFTGYDGPNGYGGGLIPINNLGLWIEPTGTNSFPTSMTTICESAASAHGLTNGSTLIIEPAAGNAGDISDNAFIFHWLMGTQQGTMETTLTMFDQLIAETFTLGDFTTTALLTLTQVP